MKLIDSHCHLDIEPLKNDASGAIERAYKASVSGMINVGSSLRGSQASVDLANNYPNIWAVIGVHPHEAAVDVDLERVKEVLTELSQNDKVVGIGEIGLDYFDFETGGEVSDELKQRQGALFRIQIRLAQELQLPIVFHVRDAWDDFFEILNSVEFSELGMTGVVHCYTGDEKILEKILAHQLHVGFTGFVTFEQAKFDHIRAAARLVPLEKTLIETDAPFLAPEPHRGKTNEPAYVVEVARKIAEIKGLSLEEVAENTYKNTKKVFNIK